MQLWTIPNYLQHCYNSSIRSNKSCCFETFSLLTDPLTLTSSRGAFAPKNDTLQCTIELQSKYYTDHKGLAININKDWKENKSENSKSTNKLTRTQWRIWQSTSRMYLSLNGTAMIVVTFIILSYSIAMKSKAP